jgi:uncharacterized protein (DUF427 family)
MTDPTHPMRIKANLNRVRAMFQGHVVADTSHALTVLEDNHAPVQYFPREDVKMSVMGKTERHTLCPRKGEASYYTISMDGEIAQDAVWSYEHPLPSALALKDYIAFYPEIVQVFELAPGDEALQSPAAHPHPL